MPFEVRQGTGVRLAGVGAGLESAKAVAQNRQQSLVGDPVDPDAIFIDGAVLERDKRFAGGTPEILYSWQAFPWPGSSNTATVRMSFPGLTLWSFRYRICVLFGFCVSQ